MHQRSRVISCAFLIFANLSLFAQSPTATVNGRVRDTTGAAVLDADVQLINELTNVRYPATTNSEGIYSIVSVPPGPYRIQVSKAGFKTIIQSNITLNVLDARAINFELPVGAVSQIVTVESGAPLVDTESASVSTVVDRQFAENLPMNGRSFQTLIDLTPGVVLVPSNGNDSGQFTVNGQRAISNYWMVDGVGANVGIGVPGNFTLSPGNGLTGTLGAFSAAGGTNSLVSVDAMQEFRIQTSTYAPEFGRTPGGQISIVTRSGTNQFHGTAFDYLRNDVLDANNWFNGYTNSPPLPKAQERQNDFGGTFSGPLLKDRTFFFFSYEGLRLRLPQTTLTTVPDLSARQNAVPAMQPFFNAYPQPNGSDDVATGIAEFNSSYSNPSKLDAYSLRIDHRLTDKWALFGRYNYSPSESAIRGGSFGLGALSVLQPFNIAIQTATAGATWIITPTVNNDFRFNYSRTNASSHYDLDNFGGAVPLNALPFPSPFTTHNSQLNLFIQPLQYSHIFDGLLARNVQRQINLVDTVSLQKGSHTLKWGVDFRRLSPLNDDVAYLQSAFFQDVPSAENGNVVNSSIASQLSVTLLLRNLGMYAQDTWRVSPRLTTTYGVRWDVDLVPESISGPGLPAATGFNLNDLSNLGLAPVGTPPYRTTYGNVAPRIGIAYQVVDSQDWQTVFRGGFGVFYDLASSEVGNSIVFGNYPFGAGIFTFGGTFPLTTGAAPPPVTPPNASNFQTLNVFDPNLKLPYTLEWNAALEQGLGRRQTISASYVGAAGRRLLQSAFLFAPNPSLGYAQLVANTGSSNYSAVQLQFQRQLSHGLQAISSYSWSHSIDTGSAGSVGVGSNVFSPTGVGGSNRGPSDFDVRNALSAGITYDVPTPTMTNFAMAVLRGWSIQNIIQVRSAPPVNVQDGDFFELQGGFAGAVRPDLVPGQPLYLFGSRYAGGKAFNVNAFTDPPSAPPSANCVFGGCPARQGTVPRNFLRGFGATQWDFAAHRDFPIYESLKLQFRAEMFNVLNHPNFGPPNGYWLSPASGGPAGFGLSTQMLGQSLNNGNASGGALSPLYQIGGPRSVQFALKLMF